MSCRSALNKLVKAVIEGETIRFIRGAEYHDESETVVLSGDNVTIENQTVVIS